MRLDLILISLGALFLMWRVETDSSPWWQNWLFFMVGIVAFGIGDAIAKDRKARK